MSWTKRQIVSEAFAELALAGFDFDLLPEETQAGVRGLDRMMAQWAATGLHVGYAAAATPDAGDPDDDSGLPLVAVNAVVLKLAMQIASGKGKALPMSTKGNAATAYAALLSWAASRDVRPQQMRAGVPAGAGAKTTDSPFLTSPNTDPLQASVDGGLFLSGT